MKLREWRLLAEMKQSELAKELDVSQATVSKVERVGVVTEAFAKAFRSVFGASAYRKIDEFKKQ